MRRAIHRLSASLAIIGLLAGAAVHVAVLAGQAQRAQPLLLAACLSMFLVGGTALSVGTEVARKLEIQWSFFPNLGELARLARAAVAGCPLWLLALSGAGFAAAIVLPGGGSASLLGELTPEEARIGANVVLIFSSLSVPVLFSTSANRWADKAAA
jgi:hypothetical protein